jgi:hypothetical protein
MRRPGGGRERESGVLAGGCRPWLVHETRQQDREGQAGRRRGNAHCRKAVRASSSRWFPLVARGWHAGGEALRGVAACEDYGVPACRHSRATLKTEVEVTKRASGDARLCSEPGRQPQCRADTSNAAQRPSCLSVDRPAARPPARPGSSRSGLCWPVALALRFATFPAAANAIGRAS